MPALQDKTRVSLSSRCCDNVILTKLAELHAQIVCGSSIEFIMEIKVTPMYMQARMYIIALVCTIVVLQYSSDMTPRFSMLHV